MVTENNQGPGRSQSLVLHLHPLSSYCQKALIGLYELDLPFAQNVVDLSNEAERAALYALWPMGKFPVLRDEARNQTIFESSCVLEYADQLRASSAPAGARLIPTEP